MQAAIFVRNTKKRRLSSQLVTASLPPHAATKQIRPFPRYNPILLPNGKNAWQQGESRRPSRRRTGGSKNKIGDASFSSQKDKYLAAGKYKQSGVVNVLLYVGFILMGLGLIMTFVGMGERGFKTKELQLIGPSLIGCGVFFTLLRILFCSFTCEKRAKPLDEKSLLSPSQETIAELPDDHIPIRIPKPKRRRSPIKVSKGPTRPPTTANTPDRPPTSPSQVQPIPNFIEDEVESDADLGLDVQYMDESKSKKDSRPSTVKTITSRLSAKPDETEFELTSVENPSNNEKELVLDASKLDLSTE